MASTPGQVERDPMLPAPTIVDTPPTPALTPRTKFLWSIGGVVDKLAYDGTSVLTQQIYVSALGLKPALFSLAVAVPRFLDIVIDPLIGHWSDNTRSRWGRRKPWMAFGAVLSGLIVILLWHPPRAFGDTGVFLFLAAALTLLFSGGYSTYVIAHNAMGYEMASGYNERTHLFKWRMWAMAAAGFLSPWLPRLCLAFEGDQADTLKGVEGVKIVGLLLGLTIIAAGLVPVLFCPNGEEARRDQAKIPWGDAVKMTLSNRPFWLLVISNVITRAGMMVTGVFFFYLITYHVGAGHFKTGTVWWGTFVNTINVAAFLAMAPVASITGRLGKKTTLVAGLAISAVVYASVWWTLTPAVPWLCLTTAACTGVFTNTLPMIKNSMLADICDLDELKTGFRREAFYSAVFVTSDKLAMAVSLACQGIVLGWSGFDAKLDLQSPETVHFWLVAIMITQPLGFLVGMIAILFYPLNNARCREIRQQLDDRAALRASLPPAGAPLHG